MNRRAMLRPPTALLADDEPLLRETLAALLAAAWPELRLVAQARNGREAIAAFDVHAPDICFLDVQMPGITGIEVARHVGRRAHVVFVTAFDRYAVEAFAHGAVDYLVKPVEPARLADTVARLRERVQDAQPPALDVEALAERLAARLDGAARGPLRWLRAGAGTTTRLIPVDDIDFLRSDEKYTLIAWNDAGRPAEALIRTPLRSLLAQLDPAQFAQVHRSVVVNLRAVRQVVRAENETAEIHLKARGDVLPVSRSYLHLFRQM